MNLFADVCVAVMPNREKFGTLYVLQHEKHSDFLIMMSNNRPHVILKVAMSLDGYIDDSSDQRRVFSNELDKQAVDELRASCDAILVGAQTIRSDNPTLRIRSDALRAERVSRGVPEDVAKVTLTRSAELNEHFEFFQNGSGEKLVYVMAGIEGEKEVREKDSRERKLALQALEKWASVVVLDELSSDDQLSELQLLLEDLDRRGVHRLLVEGGSEILSQFLTADLVDEIRLAIASITIADTTAPRAFPESFQIDERFALCSKEMLGEVQVYKYQRRRRDEGRP